MVTVPSTGMQHRWTWSLIRSSYSRWIFASDITKKLVSSHPSSYCSVPKRVFSTFSGDPFHEALAGAEDSFLCTALALLGPVVYFFGAPRGLPDHWKFALR